MIQKSKPIKIKRKYIKIQKNENYKETLEYNKIIIHEPIRSFKIDTKNEDCEM